MRNRISVLLLALSLVLSLCACKAKPTRYQQTFLDLFDTVTVVSGYAASQSEFNAAAERIHALLLEYHQLYDIYNAYDGLTNLCSINEQAALAPLAADPRILDLLQFACQMHEKTDGRVNIAMGSVLQLWHDARTAGLADPSTAALPDEAALQQAAAHTNIEDLVLNLAAGTVFLRDPSMRLDVGAVAKGYATEQVAQILAAEGMDGYVLSVGGNVRTIGPSPAGRWTVGLENPHDLSQLLGRITITEGAVVTSGSYQRYYTVEGRRYHHIIDPQTLYPSAHYASVSVLAPDSGTADALSTALFTLPQAEGLQLLARFPGAEALWVYPDGTQLASDGFEFFK